MLWYYRNPLNFVFFNEAVIICSLFSFGEDAAWKKGVDSDELFTRVEWLAKLIKREIVQ